MFRCDSPTKRKLTDSDHPENKNIDEELPSCSNKRKRNNSDHSSIANAKECDTITTQTCKNSRVKNIIEQEFAHELKSKEAQLELVDERLEEANDLLHRLRYAIVAEYYKKQEQPQTIIDATKMMQGENLLLNEERLKQISLHPSLKKIIGKRPPKWEELMGVCPKRVAAQNAKHVINTKNATERKEERRLQKVIREKGIVIDHSKQDNKHEVINVKTEINFNANTTNNKEKDTKPNSAPSRFESPKPHVLNFSRISNKSRYQFVVGNTSKYIENSDKKIPIITSTNTSFTHKWLVYVQMKDTNVSIEKYIKKVRFFLHPSYRPNDVVDIHAPPFQVARRGWGEFPMRIQMFFHDKFQQKPVQLVHKVVLDTTKSGHHTLGAETVMEVWLRDEKDFDKRVCKKEKVEKDQSFLATTTTAAEPLKTATTTTTNSLSKPRTISFTSIKEAFDDNFFDFLNKIEESRTSICADIEKIQPTVVVNEPLEPKFSNIHRSPIKKELKSPLTNTSIHLSPFRVRATSIKSAKTNGLPKSIKEATKKLHETIGFPDNSLNNKDDLETNQQTLPTTSKNAVYSAAPSSLVSIKTFSSSNCNTVTSLETKGKVFNNVSGTVILPVTKQQFPLQQNNRTQSNGLPSNAVYEKKIFQVIDAQGKVKNLQMLVATTKPMSSPAISKLTTINNTIQASNTQITQATTATKDIDKNSSTKPNLTKLVSTNSQIIKLAPSNIKSEGLKTTVVPFNKIIKPNQQSNISNVIKSTTTNLSKNVVFQKEGKLYIIDPMQVKLKQQQKHQVSLLKPQTLRKQMGTQQPQQQQTNLITSVISDHDYAPPPPTPPGKHPISTGSNYTETSSVRMPQLHLGMRTTRLNALKAQDLQKLKRVQFEKRFYRLSFSTMRSAVEYLLRRLPIIVFDKESPAASFPFVRSTQQEFQNLPAFKQRSCEWLRAKFIARMMRNVDSLQALDVTKTDTFWTTREIATFARCYAYTPPIKSLQPTAVHDTAGTTVPGTKEHFAALIKTEMKNEHLQLEYDTISPVTGITQWLKSIQQKLQLHSDVLNEEDTIVIDDDEDDENDKVEIAGNSRSNCEALVTKRIYGSPLKFDFGGAVSYLPPLTRLETAFQFVGETCKDFSIRLQPEEIVPGVVHPMAQTLLAHILKVFVDRLLRQSIANQLQQQQQQEQLHSQQASSSTVNNLPLNIFDRCITAQDMRKAIIDSKDLDFLTNRNLGVSNRQEKEE